MIQESAIAKRHIIAQEKRLPPDVRYALLPNRINRLAVVVRNKRTSLPAILSVRDVYIIATHIDRYNFLHLLSNSLALAFI